MSRQVIIFTNSCEDIFGGVCQFWKTGWQGRQEDKQLKWKQEPPKLNSVFGQQSECYEWQRSPLRSARQPGIISPGLQDREKEFACQPAAATAGDRKFHGCQRQNFCPRYKETQTCQVGLFSTHSNFCCGPSNSHEVS